jgi:hypothetical protein
MVYMMSLVCGEGGIFPQARIWLRWWWEFVESGDKLSGSSPGGEGEFLFDDLTGVDFRKAGLMRALTTCFLRGGDMRILDALRQLETQMDEQGRDANP